jgi:hypothetical protein
LNTALMKKGLRHLAFVGYANVVNQHRKLTTNQHPKLTSGHLKLLGFNTLFSLFKPIRIVARFQDIAMVGHPI